MPLTEYQRRVCRLLASERVAQGESYIAGGAALNELLTASRVSHDVDLFHDTATAIRCGRYTRFSRRRHTRRFTQTAYR